MAAHLCLRSKRLEGQADEVKRLEEMVSKLSSVYWAAEGLRDVVGYEKTMRARDHLWQAMDEIDDEELSRLAALSHKEKAE